RRAGIAVVRRAFQTPDEASPGPQNSHFEPGDTLWILDYSGEGAFHVWTQCRFDWLEVTELADPRLEDLEGVYAVRERPGSQPGKKPSGPYLRLVRDAVTEWWVHVRTLDGREGWINVDEPHARGASIDNADACG